MKLTPLSTPAYNFILLALWWVSFDGTLGIMRPRPKLPEHRVVIIFSHQFCVYIFEGYREA